MKTTALSLICFALLIFSQVRAADGDALKTTTKDSPFVNSLRMKFVPVPETNVLFSIWDTRVKDFRAYANETNYHQTGGLMKEKAEIIGNVFIGLTGHSDCTADWEHPGFDQTEDQPVVGVSWIEAKAFCAWLSKKEGRAYRLPTSAEWTAAAGPTKYPWGNTWPPPKTNGNFGDKAYFATFKLSYHSELGEYDDGYVYTSPVGVFVPNWLGLYDMAGNVCQWCEDWHDPMNMPEMEYRKECRVVRGSSWRYAWRKRLVSIFPSGDELFSEPSYRNDQYGFRCVLEVLNKGEKK